MADKKELPPVRINKKAITGSFKKIMHHIWYKLILPLAYQYHCRKPIDEKLVAFVDYRRLEMPDNFCGIYQKCQKAGFRCEVLTGAALGGSQSKWKKKRNMLFFSFRFIAIYAQCSFLFLDDWFPLADIVKPRKGTQVIQLWHACGVMKKWGHASVETKWGKSRQEQQTYPDYASMTLAVVSSFSERVIRGYQAAYDCDIHIIEPLGCPRTDVYFDDCFRKSARQRVFEKIPEICGREIILYAPTFRGNSIPESYIDCNFDFKGMKDALSDRYVFITKFHPLVSKIEFPATLQMEGQGFVFDGTRLLTVEEALCAADILITDYSSIIFEYYLLERPVISYIYDIDTYDEDRGLFYPYDQLAPGPYVFTQKDLVEKLLTVDEWFDIERIRTYKEEFMSACDGHSTQRIYNRVFGDTTEGDQKTE